MTDNTQPQIAIAIQQAPVVQRDPHWIVNEVIFGAGAMIACCIGVITGGIVIIILWMTGKCCT